MKDAGNRHSALPSLRHAGRKRSVPFTGANRLFAEHRPRAPYTGLWFRRLTYEFANPLLAWVTGGLRAPTAASRRASPRDRDARHRALGGSGPAWETSSLTSLAQPVTTPTRVGHRVEQDAATQAKKQARRARGEPPPADAAYGKAQDSAR